MILGRGDAIQSLIHGQGREGVMVHSGLWFCLGEMRKVQGGEDIIKAQKLGPWTEGMWREN